MSAPVPTTLPPDENRGHVYLGTLVGFLIVSISIATLRTWTRIKYAKLWWDDYLALAAFPFLFANNILSIMSIHYGIGRHIEYIMMENPLNAMQAAKLNVIAQPLNVWALFFVKVSILFLLLRLNPGRIYKIILYITLALLFIITVAIFAITMSQCQPLEREWNPTIKGFCWSGNIFTDFTYVLSGITILTDLVYIIIPIFYLWDVKLKKSLKYGIWAILGLGSISMGCTIASIPFIKELGQSQDVTYNIINLASIKTAELNIAILTACIPPLQPLFIKATQKLSTGTRGTKTAETWESRQARLKNSGSSYEMLSSKTAVNSNISRSYTGERDTYGRTCTCGNCNINCAGYGKNQKGILATTDISVDREV